MQISYTARAAVNFSGLEAGSELAVHNVTGSLVSSFRAESDEEDCLLTGQRNLYRKERWSRKSLKLLSHNNYLS